jgi:hypothetical protein
MVGEKKEASSVHLGHVRWLSSNSIIYPPKSSSHAKPYANLSYIHPHSSRDRNIITFEYIFTPTQRKRGKKEKRKKKKKEKEKEKLR